MQRPTTWQPQQEQADADFGPHQRCESLDPLSVCVLLELLQVMWRQELLTSSKAIMYLHKIKSGANGIAQHSEDDSEVIPPESVNDPDPSEDAQEEDDDYEDEEKGCEDVDGIAPGAFVHSTHG